MVKILIPRNPRDDLWTIPPLSVKGNSQIRVQVAGKVHSAQSPSCAAHVADQVPHYDIILKSIQELCDMCDINANFKLWMLL